MRVLSKFPKFPLESPVYACMVQRSFGNFENERFPDLIEDEVLIQRYGSTLNAEITNLSTYACIQKEPNSLHPCEAVLITRKLQITPGSFELSTSTMSLKRSP